MKIKQITKALTASTLLLSTSAFAVGMTFGNNADNQHSNEPEPTADTDNTLSESMSESMGGGEGGLLTRMIEANKSVIDKAKRNIQGILQAPASVDEKVAASTGINGTILKDIFWDAPYEDYETTPYPRVALTFHSVPPFHNEMTSAAWLSSGPNGCWNLSAVVWHSSTERQDVEPFDWCMPHNQEYGVAFSDLFMWLNQPVFVTEESTGARRTVGPIPPDKAAPSHPRYRKFYNSDYLTTETANGYMFGSILYQMGFDWKVRADRRVWIVDFEPARVM